MNRKAKLMNGFTCISLLITGFSIAGYFVIRIFQYYIYLKPASGDEQSYLAVYNMFINEGFVTANIFGNSTFFNICSYVFYFFSERELLSMRLCSLFFGMLSFIVLWKFIHRFFNFSQKVKWVVYLTMLNVVIVKSNVFMGINDTILVFLTVSFFYVLYSINTTKNPVTKYFLALGLILAVSLSTRLMALIAFPGFLYCIFLVLKKQKAPIAKSVRQAGIIIITFLLATYSLNFPSLSEKGTLSFHLKESGYKGITWSQMQYLSAIGQEKGEIEHNAHYSWEKVREYLDTNGEDSLPKTVFESIFFDIKRTVKEFFKDVLLLTIPFTRLLGPVFFLGLLLFTYQLSFKKISIRNILESHILMFFIIYVSIICFIIISNVETRWLIHILVLLPVLIFDQIIQLIKKHENHHKKFEFALLNTQLLTLTFFNLPFIADTLSKLF